jgi:alpha-beta hydrolase superfamily lysophospholipase
MKSEDGICATFPKARILLYMYESAWQGQLKVNQFMDNISKTLLVALRAKREKCKQRPIVFIGHSMGGLVIAKAITILNAQPELCPVMFEAISAAVFFGTPFAGAPAAAWASSKLFSMLQVDKSRHFFAQKAALPAFICLGNVSYSQSRQLE